MLVLCFHWLRAAPSHFSFVIHVGEEGAAGVCVNLASGSVTTPWSGSSRWCSQRSMFLTVPGALFFLTGATWTVELPELPEKTRVRRGLGLGLNEAVYWKP